MARALLRIVREAGRLEPVAAFQVEAGLASSFSELRQEMDLVDNDDSTTIAVISAWTQLFGLLTFELFGQTRNMVIDDAALFRSAAAAMATVIGLRE